MYYCDDCSFATNDDEEIDDHENGLGHTMTDQYNDWDEPEGDHY